MKTISTVQCGIKALEEVLNRIVAAVNARTVVAGAGLTSQETQESIVISLTPKDDDQGQTGTQGGGAGSAGVPVTIQAFDASNNPVTLTVMTDGSGFGTSTLVWQPVAVVDPATCVRSTVTVLEKPTS